jgi:hypothetical protein
VRYADRRQVGSVLGGTTAVQPRKSLLARFLLKDFISHENTVMHNF